MKEETKLVLHEIEQMKKHDYTAEKIVAFLQGWFSSELKYPVEYTTEDLFIIIEAISEKRVADLEGQVQGQQINYTIALNTGNCDTDDLVKKYFSRRKKKEERRNGNWKLKT